MYATTLAGQELSFVAYVDTACAKSVVGQAEADALEKHCKAVEWPCVRVPESEPFRFGPGKQMWSEWALVFAVVWAEHVVVLRVSVVSPDVPFLLSKSVFKRLGAQIALGARVCLFRQLDEKSEALHDLPTGHVGIQLC